MTTSTISSAPAQRPRRPSPSVALRFVVLSALVAAPALAAAPRDQYFAFTNDSTVIHDAKTDLQWERRLAPREPVSYEDATEQCKLFEAAKGGGRLPTIKELLTILDEEPTRQFQSGAYVTKYIDIEAFPRTASPVDRPYWTSTPTGDGRVWTLSFADGQMIAADPTGSSTFHYRCVR